MCLPERNTERRARSLIRDWIFERTRATRWVKCSFDLLMPAVLLLLAFLAQDGLALVLDALALIRLGLAEGTDFGGHLADLLMIGATHRNLGRALALDGD